MRMITQAWTRDDGAESVNVSAVDSATAKQTQTRGAALATKRLRGLRQLFRAKRSTEEQYLVDQRALLREYEAVGRARHDSFADKQKVAVEMLNTGMQALEGLVLEIPSVVWDKIARAQFSNSSRYRYHGAYSGNNSENAAADMPPPPRGLPLPNARPALGQQRRGNSLVGMAGGAER
jgi:hypothetical protein